MRIDEIGPVEVAAWFDATSRDRFSLANRALGIWHVIMFKAAKWGWCAHDTNPCLGIRRNPHCKVARFLDADDLEGWTHSRRPRGRMAGSRRRGLPAGTHWMPTRRSARSSMVRHWAGGNPPFRQQDRAVRRGVEWSYPCFPRWTLG